MRKPGRPPLKEGAKSVIISVRFTEGESKLLRTMNSNVSDYIRGLALAALGQSMKKTKRADIREAKCRDLTSDSSK